MDLETAGGRYERDAVEHRLCIDGRGRLVAGRVILALGADLKGTFAWRGGPETRCFTGFGDLARAECFDQWTAAIEQAIDGAVLETIVVDLHPLYRSHHFGRRLARRTGARLIPLQHHVAHAEAVRAEHGFARPYLGLVLDGTGFGPDGTVWGCELLRIDDNGWTRIGRLRSVVCPGADLAAREIWRMGLSWLEADGESNSHFDSLGGTIDPERMKVARAQIRAGRPLTTSAGRAFDAAAAIIGIRTEVEEEGEAARALEALATTDWPSAGLKYSVNGEVLDLTPAMRDLSDRVRDGASAMTLAAAFHETLIAGLVELVVSTAADCERRIVLAGGCFLNAILSHEIPLRLAHAGFLVHQAITHSPGDDALALGQLEAVGPFRDEGRAVAHPHG